MTGATELVAAKGTPSPAPGRTAPSSRHGALWSEVKEEAPAEGRRRGT